MRNPYIVFKQNAVFKQVIFILVVVLFSACGEGNVRITKKDFPDRISLFAEKVTIKEIIRPVAICILDDYLVIQNDQIRNMDCFYIYDIETLKFLYSFGRIGLSGEEYQAPLLVEKNIGNKLSVFDQHKRIMNTYNISQEKAVTIDQKRIIEEDKYPIQEMSFVNDSVILYLTVFNKLISYNINTGMAIDALEFETGLKERMDNSYNQSFDFFHFSNYNSNFIVGHNFVDNVFISSLDDDFTFRTNKVSLKEKTPYIQSKLFDNTFYYIFVYASKKYLFAQYYGFPFSDLQPFPIHIGTRNFNYLFEVYDWELHKKTLVEFDSDILRCAVDEKRKTIYTWNPLEDFDYILLYKYNF